MCRGKLTALGVLALALMAGGFAAGCGGEDEQTAETDSEAVVAFSEPPRVSVRGGVRLTAEENEFVAAGQRVKGRSYNGQFVGPTLVMQPGEPVNLQLVDHLVEETNLHFHGFHVTPKIPSDQVVEVSIPPGGYFNYRVPIPSNHDQGTFWYHSHAHDHSDGHGLSEGQVFGGMSGVALIGTPPYPNWVKPAADRLLALKDFQVKNGEIPRTEIESGAETTRTVNGLLEPQISAAPNTTQLWRLANIGADIFYDVELEGSQFWVVDEDGNAPTSGVMWAAQDLVLPPGKRYDVLVQFKNPGTYALKTLEYNTGSGGDNYPEATLATVAVSGTPGNGPTLSQGQLAQEQLPQPTRQRTKVLTENEKTSTFTINGKTYDPDRVDDTVKVNTVEDWTFDNKTNEQHPIHIHQDDFWVVAENGQPVTPKEQQDTVIVPPGESRTLRIPFSDFEGKFVYHCHILNHEDNGMMAVIEVNATGNEAKQTAPVHHDHSTHAH